MKHIFNALIMLFVFTIEIIVIVVWPICLLLWYFDYKPVVSFWSDVRLYMKDSWKFKITFPKKKNDGNVNDWKAWTPGDIKWWVINDGDNIQKEATNIIEYITAHGFDQVTNADSFGHKLVTIDSIVEKLTKAGYGEQAEKLKQHYHNQRTLTMIKDIFKDNSNEN